MTKNTCLHTFICCFLGIVLGALPAFAGGPLILFDPAGRVPFAYGPTIGFPVPVFTDLGSMGPLTNAEADDLTAAGIGSSGWSGVVSSSFSASIAGDFTSRGLPDIDSADPSDPGFAGLVIGTFNGGGIDVIYDDTGAIISDFFGAPPGVLGIASPDFSFVGSPELAESWVVLNGAAVDPADIPPTVPIPGATFAGVFTHEFGHAINLAHSQTNGAILFFGDDIGPAGCPVPYSGSPGFPDQETMYPFIDVTAGSVGIDMATVDHPDDISALSDLYPAAGWPVSFGTITGTIILPDALTEVTGVNVIARNFADPFADAVSALSGDFTQGDLGPDGLYTFNGLTAGADYVVYTDEIVAGGFSTPPAPVGIEEFWNGASESSDPATDDPCDLVTITAGAGATFVADIIINEFVSATPGVSYATTGGSGADTGSLFTVDPATGAATLVGPTGFAQVPGLAINSAGEIFGSDGGDASGLIRIDATTGTSLSVGIINIGGTSLPFVDAIAFDENDVLFGIDDNNNLITIDPTNGDATIVGFTGVIPAPFLVGMAFEPGTGRLFASTGGLGGFDQIYEIDPATGAATLIGNTGLGSGAIPDLHFANGTMFGSKNISGTFNLITIDPAGPPSMLGTVVGPFGTDLRVSGLAVRPPVRVIRVRKQAILADLSSIPLTGDKKTDKRIEKAIDKITKSLADDLWEDNFHLTMKGKKVFKEEEKAVRELMKIVKDGGPLAGDAQTAIEGLVGVDASLAQIAIAEAIDGGGKPKEINKAQKEIAKGKFDKAIKHYKKAWEHAQ